MNNRNEPIRPQVIPNQVGSRNFVKSVLVIVIGIISTIYIFNPTAGLLELLPDNLPLIGNLDEAAAVALLLSCFAYFGIDLRPFASFFSRKI